MDAVVEQPSAIDALEARILELERHRKRMSLSRAVLLRLEPGDILTIVVPRPLASSERDEMIRGFRELLASVGHADVGVAIVCSMADIDFQVVRPT